MKLLPLFAATMIASTVISAPLPNFSDFSVKVESGKDVSVVFLGGSLTWGAQATNPQRTSYRALINQKLERIFDLTTRP